MRTLSAIPVRTLNHAVLSWPKPELILAVMRGVGSDLDLLLVDGAAIGPQQQRLLSWPWERLPLSCDVLVLTLTELQELLASGTH